MYHSVLLKAWRLSHGTSEDTYLLLSTTEDINSSLYTTEVTHVSLSTNEGTDLSLSTTEDTNLFRPCFVYPQREMPSQCKNKNKHTHSTKTHQNQIRKKKNNSRRREKGKKEKATVVEDPNMHFLLCIETGRRWSSCVCWAFFDWPSAGAINFQRAPLPGVDQRGGCLLSMNRIPTNEQGFGRRTVV